MKKLLLFFLISVSTYVWAEAEGIPPVQADTSQTDGDTNNIDDAANVLETEKTLNDILLQVNKTFESHAKIMKLKLRSLPKNVMAYKGVADGDNCKKAENQEDSANNCLMVEYYDFVGSEEGFNQGSKSKSVTIFFEGSASGDNPKTEKDRKVSKIKSKVVVDNFEKLDKKSLEIIDSDPTSDPSHDDKISVFVRIDDNPPRSATQTLSNKGVGKYSVATIDNSKLYPVRNSFKRDAYIKHLFFFERLFSKIYFYNDKKGNQENEKQIKFLETNLKY
jgi:hypothetical protein